jgi:hypothetical protein
MVLWFGRMSHNWKNTISVHLKEIGWESVGWIDLAQDRDNWWVVVNAVMNVPVQ